MSAAARVTPEPAELRAFTMFADLSDADLAWIAEQSELVELEPGGTLFLPGDPADWMFLILEGVLEARREQLAANSPVFSFRAGEVTGMLPFSRMTEFPGAGRALTRARVARFPKARFPELLRRIPVLEPRFVAHLADRVRDVTRRDQQYEKLTALGKLAAGLAHELNNPAAAARRAAADARARIDAMGRLAATLAGLGLGARAVASLDAARSRGAAARDSSGVDADPLARGDREDEVVSWLSAAGVRDPWVSAATFVDAKLAADDLARAVAEVPAPARAPALAWLEAGLAADALLRDVEHATERISALVAAVKAYTHMDRAPQMERVDVREGIESTLALFAHRVKEKQITLERDLAPALPELRAYPGELNQVWSNLLDNALDAVAPRTGRVKVRAAVVDGAVVVEVVDDGPGVPEEIRDRVWEPFFTTKEVGRGTGLGLDIARRIVTEHGGQLELASAPGETRFVVRLPLGRRAT